jgi:hypothetical protein
MAAAPRSPKDAMARYPRRRRSRSLDLRALQVPRPPSSQRTSSPLPLLTDLNGSPDNETNTRSAARSSRFCPAKSGRRQEMTGTAGGRGREPRRVVLVRRSPGSPPRPPDRRTGSHGRCTRVHGRGEWPDHQAHERVVAVGFRAADPGTDPRNRSCGGIGRSCRLKCAQIGDHDGAFRTGGRLAECARLGTLGRSRRRRVPRDHPEGETTSSSAGARCPPISEMAANSIRARTLPFLTPCIQRLQWYLKIATRRGRRIRWRTTAPGVR